MNPSQSQSLWKSMLQEDLLRFKKVNSLFYHNNNPQMRVVVLQSSTTPITNSKLIHLQNQYNMQTANTKNSDWNPDQQQKFFTLHREYGNKWALISRKMDGKPENCVKNKFYSTIRKGFRKLNNYIVNIKRKRGHPLLSCNKLLKPEFITKLIALADRNFQQKYEAKPIAISLSVEIRSKLIQLARSSSEYQQNLSGDFVEEQKLLQKIHDFNRNCKRRKGKKKHPIGEKISQEQNQDSQGMSEREISLKEKMQENNLGINIKEVVHYVEKVDAPRQQQKNEEKMQEKGDQFRVINSQFDLLLEQADETQKNRQFNCKINRTPSASTSFAGGSMNFLIAPSPLVNNINSDFYLTPGGHFRNSRLRISRSSFNSNILGNLTQKDGDQTIQIAQNCPFMKDNKCNEMFFKSTELKKQMEDKSYTFDGKICNRSLSTLPESQKSDNFLKKYEQWIPILQTKQSALSLAQNSNGYKYEKVKKEVKILQQ